MLWDEFLPGLHLLRVATYATYTGAAYTDSASISVAILVHL